MGDRTAEHVRELMRDKACFDVRALAMVEESIGHFPAENPVQRRDVRCFEYVEITTNNRRFLAVSLGHRALEFFEPPRRVSEYQMEIEDTYRCPIYRYVDIESPAVANFREEARRHGMHEESCTQRQELPVLLEGYLSLCRDRMFRKDDVIHRYGT